jgi:hypothetical protein
MAQPYLERLACISHYLLEQVGRQHTEGVLPSSQQLRLHKAHNRCNMLQI